MDTLARVVNFSFDKPLIQSDARTKLLLRMSVTPDLNTIFYRGSVTGKCTNTEFFLVLFFPC